MKKSGSFALALVGLFTYACDDSTTSSPSVECVTSADCPTGHICFHGRCQTFCEINSTQAEVCDGRDNDCDGETDEGMMNACGGCHVLTAGLNTQCDGPDTDFCPEGIWECRGRDLIVCTDTTDDSIEVCNGRDDDCDGRIDEKLEQWLEGSGVGVCRLRVLTCRDGQVVELNPGRAPQPEVWNMLDDDCNGLVDDNIPLGPPLAIRIEQPPPDQPVFPELVDPEGYLEVRGIVDHPLALVTIQWGTEGNLEASTFAVSNNQSRFTAYLAVQNGANRFVVSASAFGRQPGELVVVFQVCGSPGCPRYGATRCQGESTIERCQELPGMLAGCPESWVALPDQCPWYGPCVEQDNNAYCDIVGTLPNCGVCYRSDCQGSPWNGYWYSFGAAGGGWAFLCCVGPCSEDGRCPRGTYCSEGRCVPRSFCEWGPCDRECCADPPDPRLIDVNSYCCHVIQQCRGG